MNSYGRAAKVKRSRARRALVLCAAHVASHTSCFLVHSDSAARRPMVWPSWIAAKSLRAACARPSATAESEEARRTCSHRAAAACFMCGTSLALEAGQRTASSSFFSWRSLKYAVVPPTSYPTRLPASSNASHRRVEAGTGAKANSPYSKQWRRRCGRDDANASLSGRSSLACQPRHQTHATTAAATTAARCR